MPLPSDPKVVALAEELLQQFDLIFGRHPGFRPVHAKGLLLTGTFTPSPEARSLTRAPHAERDSTPVSVRFSDSPGIPMMPDNDPNANPRGMATRFHLAERVHTDIIGHSYDGFPVRTAHEFLELLKALAASSEATTSPKPIETFVSTRPAALAFVQPRPIPVSFATEAYFGVTALRFTNKDGASRFGRFRIKPDAGVEHLDEPDAKSKGPDFLFEELTRRVGTNPIGFQVLVQIANEGDVVDDATHSWPADRQLVDFGKITLTAVEPENAREQQRIIFDPVPRVDGIDPSADPLLELRSAIYLLSGRRHRQDPEVTGNVEAAKA
jgi:catalase